MLILPHAIVKKSQQPRRKQAAKITMKERKHIRQQSNSKEGNKEVTIN